MKETQASNLTSPLLFFFRSLNGNVLVKLGADEAIELPAQVTLFSLGSLLRSDRCWWLDRQVN